MDALAGNIAFIHCDDNNPNTRRASLVTASVDRIVQQRVMSAKDDLVLSAQVAWVGRSSLDVVVEVHRSEDIKSTDGAPTMVEPTGSRLLSSYFTYVARNRETNRATAVNRLVVNSDAERSLFAAREAQAASRKRRDSAMTLDPQVSQLVAQGRAAEDMPALAPPDAVLMRCTSLESSLVCQPQSVNTAGRVFGGFIMNKAYELALSTCYVFAGAHPVFREVDRIAFRQPVDVGDLLRLTSRVIFTSSSSSSSFASLSADEEVQRNVPPSVVVEVNCQVVRPERASSVVSNTFHFVFGFACDEARSPSLRRVLPVTSEEATMWIYGSKLLKTAPLSAGDDCKKGVAD
eukprot:gene21658-27699_t